MEVVGERYKRTIPRTIVQFWDNLDRLPQDVDECIASWRQWKPHGFAHHLFDRSAASQFISNSLGARYERTFQRCYHPSMQADYFRLCYLLIEGGFYVDADDVCIANEIGWLFEDGRLKLQPLCTNLKLKQSINSSEFLDPNVSDPDWIFSFNNTPLISCASHPIVERALGRATSLLEAASEGELLEIEATTGPGNLSEAVFDLGTRPDGDVETALVALRDWNLLAVTRLDLSYREDSRNWRSSNQKKFDQAT